MKRDSLQYMREMDPAAAALGGELRGEAADETMMISDGVGEAGGSLEPRGRAGDDRDTRQCETESKLHLEEEVMSLVSDWWLELGCARDRTARVVCPVVLFIRTA